ncbi:MAG: DMT family transporter [Thermoplasmatota archaeon]
MELHGKHVGVAAVLAASVMWAIEPIAARLSYGNADALHTVAIRAIVVAAVAFFYVVATRRETLHVSRRELPPLVYLAVVGTLFADALYLLALQRTAVVNAVLIGHLQPVFIVALSIPLLKKDRLTAYDGAGITLMMFSAWLVSTRTPSRIISLEFGTWGDAFVLAATVAWASTAVAMRKYLTGLHAGVITFYRFALASLVMLGYLAARDLLVVANGWQVVVGVVVAVGTILYYEGLKRLKAAQVSALELAAPFFAAILAWLALGEAVTGMQMAGLMFLVFGVLLLARRERLPQEPL